MRKRTGARRKESAPGVPATARTSVFLVGFMGAGKSSVGRALGDRLNWVFEDLDDRIMQREGRSVAEIFRDSGESAFRQAEHATLRRVLEELRGGVARVVALGGGAFVQPDNIKLLKSAGVPTVFLDAPVEELWRRCRRQAEDAGTERPLLQSTDQFGKLYQDRRKSYSGASLRVATGGRTIDDIAAEIEQTLGLKVVAVRTEQGDDE